MTRAMLQTIMLMGAFFVSAELGAETVWIDVRSAAEHLLNNIDGDMRVAHDDVLEAVSRSYPDKDTDIALYCGSGGRAGIAAGALKAAGYTRVTNAGGIDDARRLRDLAE